MLSRHSLILIASILLILGSASLRAQVPTGKEFIVALPSVLSGPERDADKAGFYIEVLTSRTTVVTARFGDGTLIAVQTIANSNRAIFTKPYISLRRIMQNPDPYFTEIPNNSCVVITTDQPVSVQAVLDTGYRAEAYMVWPTAAYEKEYRLITYSGNVTGDGRNGFIVTAAFDNTDLYITPSVHTLGDHPPGGEYLVRLNRNDVYEVKSVNINAGALTDLTGTRIRSSKPVGVLSFSVTNLPRESPGLEGRKPIIEGLPPLGFAGTEYVILPFYGSVANIPAGTITTWSRFTPLEYNTTIDTNGVQLPGSFNPGSYVDIPVTSPLSITASRPVLGMAFAPSSDLVLFDTTAVYQGTTYPVRIPYGNPMMLWLPPANTWSSALHFGNLVISRRAPFNDPRPNTPSLNLDKMGSFSWIHFATIIVPVDAVASVRVDGASVPFTTIIPGGKYAATRLSLVGTRHVVVASQPLCALVYGFTWNDSYGTNAGVMQRGVAALSPDTLRFSTCEAMKDTAIRVFNTGTGILRIDSLRVTGLDATIITSDSLPYTFGPNGSLGVTLRVKLAPPGDFNGELRVYSDAYLAGVVAMPIVIHRDSSRLGIPSTIDLGLLGPGETTRDTTITLQNRGTAPLVITGAVVSGVGFTTVGLSLPDTIAPGGTSTIRVRLTAASDGARSGMLRLIGEPCLTPVDITLQGFKGSGAVIVAARSIDYPSLLCTIPSTIDSTLLLKNIGSEPLGIDSVRVSGPNAAEFTLLDLIDGRNLLPGDTASFRVRYTPAGVGDRRAVVTIYSNASNAPSLTTDLRARRDTAALRSVVDTVDFGTLLSCGGDTTSERSIRIRNVGTVTDTITGLDLGGIAAYSIISSTPIVVQPGTEQEVRIRFASSTPGVYTGTLRVTGSPCGVETTTLLRGRIDAPSLNIERTTVDFDTLLACDSFPSVRDLILTNNGATPDTIVSLDLAGSNLFTLTSPLPIVIPPGESDTIRITFTPTSSGRQSATAELRWGPCSGLQRITLTGWVATPLVTIDADTIDFGSIDVGDSVERSFVLRNSGDAPRTLRAIDLPSTVALQVISQSLPITLPTTLLPGDSVTITFEFRPTAADSLRSTARVHIDDPCGRASTIILLGESRPRIDFTGDIWLVVPDTVAQIDDLFSLPITIEQSRNLNVLLPTALEFVIRSRYTLFDPRLVATAIPGATATIVHDYIIGQERFLRLRLSLGTATLPDSGEIMCITALALLGDTDRTALLLDSAATETEPGRSITITPRNGTFRTLGICSVGGNRYIRLRGSLVTRIVRPNPTSGDATLEYITAHDSRVRIRIYNLYGEKVATLHDEPTTAGEHATIFHGGAMPSGAYRIEIQSDQESTSQWIIVGQ